MSYWQAVVLGIVQGLGEFLPISSSGHLIVVPWLLGWASHGLAFDVALHLSPLVAVVGAFWRDWWNLARGAAAALVQRRLTTSPEARQLFWIVLATVPGAVAGKLLDEWAETVFRSPLLVAASLSVMGLVLWAADRHVGDGGRDEIGAREALLIGCAQAFAIVPGVSRSGATIAAALFLGRRRESAARFSFLLATPITAGAVLVKVPGLLRTSPELGMVAVGVVTAAVVGLLAIRWLLAYVRTRSYAPFAIYRLAVSLLIVALWAARR